MCLVISPWKLILIDKLWIFIEIRMFSKLRKEYKVG